MLIRVSMSFVNSEWGFEWGALSRSWSRTCLEFWCYCGRCDWTKWLLLRCLCYGTLTNKVTKLKFRLRTWRLIIECFPTGSSFWGSVWDNNKSICLFPRMEYSGGEQSFTIIDKGWFGEETFSFWKHSGLFYFWWYVLLLLLSTLQVCLATMPGSLGRVCEGHE